ncbi:IS110 family transposase [Corynebacterium tuberculostearicum]|uniref:IS110 family transposase n=1 Tax=Corynebacterium tuberculostearicum TaxID=38304 RepID=UPI002934E4F9|nr:IS110 family transposase [Corynebacterium tuberculostearicum]MDV2431674.1 IS110 family transposase [Corynebacterium tuberculostearicum]
MTYDYVIGMDVGKYFHHACVLDIDGTQVLSKRINQNEKSLRTLFSTFSAHDHKVLVVVDQPNNIGRLTVAVAQDIGIDVRYLPGLAMRQLSRIHAGNAKTDIRDAYIIAHAAKNLPESLRSVDRVEEAFLQLKVLNGIDEDLARSYTRLINQIRSALVGCYPQFEQALRGQIIHRKWVLHLLARYGGPTKIKRLGQAKTAAFARRYKARNPEPVLDAIFAAISEQTVTIAGAHYAEMGVAMSAKDALLKLEHRQLIEKEVIELINDIPHTQILLSMPGIGPKTAAQILMTAGDMSDFPSAGHLASYAGLSPRTNQSGTSIMSNSLNRAGNKKLKNALWQSSFASIRFHERSRQFYERKRRDGKRHNAAVVALARRRLNVLYAMMRNHECYRDPALQQEGIAA